MGNTPSHHYHQEAAETSFQSSSGSERKAGIKKASRSFTFGNMEKIIADLKLQVSDLEKKRAAEIQAHNEMKLSLETRLAELEKEREADVKALDEENATKLSELEQYIDKQKKQSADCQALLEETDALKAEMAKLSLASLEKNRTSEVPALKAEVAEKDQIIADLKQKWEADRNALDQMKQTFEAKVAEMERSISDFEPFVTKGLRKIMDGNAWHALTDFNEEPKKISVSDSNNLVIDDVVSRSAKKLVVNGAISMFEENPFEEIAAVPFEGNACIVSELLKKVDDCKVASLFLHDQWLSRGEYEKLTSGDIKNLYFSNVRIRDEDHSLVQLEDILDKLPTIEKFRYDIVGTWRDEKSYVYSITKDTAKVLVKLPCFEKLQEFKLYNIVHEEFDADAFIDFMKKHPNASFTLSLCSILPEEFDAIKEKMLGACPSPDKLTLEVFHA